MIITLFALFPVDALFGNLEYFAVIFIKLLILEVAFGCLFELSIYLFPVEGLVHHVLDIVHLLFVVVALEDGLDLLGLEVFVGKLLGHEVDVLAGLTGVEEQELELVVGWKELLIRLHQVLQLDLQSVVQHQRRVLQPRHFQGVHLQVDATPSAAIIHCLQSLLRLILGISLHHHFALELCLALGRLVFDGFDLVDANTVESDELGVVAVVLDAAVSADSIKAIDQTVCFFLLRLWLCLSTIQHLIDEDNHVVGHACAVFCDVFGLPVEVV
jgi:hypothetical protein